MRVFLRGEDIQIQSYFMQKNLFELIAKHTYDWVTYFFSYSLILINVLGSTFQAESISFKFTVIKGISLCFIQMEICVYYSVELNQCNMTFISWSATPSPPFTNLWGPVDNFLFMVHLTHDQQDIHSGVHSSPWTNNQVYQFSLQFKVCYICTGWGHYAWTRWGTPVSINHFHSDFHSLSMFTEHYFWVGGLHLPLQKVEALAACTPIMHAYAIWCTRCT